MNIADISMTTLASSDIASGSPKNIAQAVANEFETMFIQTLLRASHIDETNAESSEMGMWNDMWARSLAQELAGQGGFGFSQSLMTELTSTGEGK